MGTASVSGQIQAQESIYVSQAVADITDHSRHSSPLTTGMASSEFFPMCSSTRIVTIKIKHRGLLAFLVKLSTCFFNRNKNKWKCFLSFCITRANQAVYPWDVTSEILCWPLSQHPHMILTLQTVCPFFTSWAKGRDSILFIPMSPHLAQGLAQKRCREIFVSQIPWKMEIMHLKMK